MSEYFTDLMGMLWVQPDGPGTISHPLFCHDLDGTDAPQGDITTALCRTPGRGWETVVESQGAPSRATGTIETWLAKTRGWLQKKSTERCPVSLYVHHTECPPDNIFSNYESGQGLQYAYFTTKGRGNQVKQMGEENQSPTTTGMTFDWTARPNPPEYWKLDAVRRAIAEDEPLRDISFCNTPSCGGACGAYQAQCDEGIIVADSDGVAAADVWFSTDGGATWAAQAGPWGVATDNNSCVCVYTAPDSVRHIVQLGTTAGGTGANAEIAYSDDAGATWTVVATGAVAGEFGMHSGGLFALDQNNIWACTDQSNIYFSSDAGATWTDQAAPSTGVLYYVHFVDERYGWCVGDTQEVVRTSDGGEHWAAPAALPGAGTDIFYCCAAVTGNVAWVGGSNVGGTAGVLFRTADGGATWTDYLGRLQAAQGFSGTITVLGDVMFTDEFNGAVTGNVTISAVDYQGTWRTFDGGWNWEFHYNDGLDGAVELAGGNALWVCDYNHIFSVGEVADATGQIIELSAIGSV